jgi:hypothetical protein
MARTENTGSCEKCRFSFIKIKKNNKTGSNQNALHTG